MRGRPNRTRRCACQRRLCNGLTVTDVSYNLRSSTRRLPEHRMVPADVCDGQEQARSTLVGREVDLTTRRCVCQRRSRNGSTVTDVRYNIHSSTNGLPEHRMVPADVCDGQDQARSTSGGREVDLTTRQYAYQRRSCNGLNATDVGYNIHSSTNRLPEHHMVPAEVCDGQDPVRSTSCGRDIDTTLPASVCFARCE